MSIEIVDKRSFIEKLIQAGKNVSTLGRGDLKTFVDLEIGDQFFRGAILHHLAKNKNGSHDIWFSITNLDGPIFGRIPPDIMAKITQYPYSSKKLAPDYEI